MQRSLGIRNHTSHLVMTSSGAALSFDGFVDGANASLVSIACKLGQGDISVDLENVLVDFDYVSEVDDVFGRTGTSCERSSFYASCLVPYVAGLVDGKASIAATLGWTDGTKTELLLFATRLLIVEKIDPPALSAANDDPLIGIVLATYNPNIDLFRKQIRSISAQIYPNWICVISDDNSNAALLAGMRDIVASDVRFMLVENKSNLGFLRNFERAAAMLPSECGMFAFSDQDDVWHQDRLQRGFEACRETSASCCFSDMRIVTERGHVLSETFWVHRRRHYGTLGGLLLANVATGMTMIGERKLLDRALPFPSAPGQIYHDHWVALLAAAEKKLNYISTPLVDYVQHGKNHTGALLKPRPMRSIVANYILKNIVFMFRKFRSTVTPAYIRNQGLVNWLGAEPTRLRVLSHSLRARDTDSKTDIDRVVEMTDAFDLLPLLRNAGDLRDVYRLSVIGELAVASGARRHLRRGLRTG